MKDTDKDYFERLVDQQALRNYLSERLGPVEEYSVRYHAEGHSNETLFVTWGDRELVVRRPPPGETAETAHDVLRESRVLDTLQDTDVPIPKTVLACEDHSVVGSDFYVMKRVEGDVLRDEEPDRFETAESRRRIGEELVDTLAAIHTVDYGDVGLGEFGHPAGYTERQVERWTQQLEWAFERTADERTVPELREVGDWLADNCPSDHEHALVHGDYKLDNVMYTPGTPPELAAVLDWEMATLGDPLADLGWMLAYWRDPGDPDPATPELTATFMESEEYPTRRDLVERYERETGIEYEHGRFYRTLAVYKLAALGEMFYRRYLEGNSDDPMYPLMEQRVSALARRAERIIEGNEPL
ncbi:phosphotransferase family protein (plasmid) [Haloferax mediterranei ATCC 33500]|uniref:Aminoglycoside phosphotransferase n=1 Tax=Haloferax mediterranei (strain ATCC 33500 / DSM 1411 / JCM 8866 / NBRC 14739 / NCIMB 2177 / R-4) TaxID=523841 RepID=I3R900_HALMT|nr:phosphotransferase family protein [Haloferax mediterranei]AFK20710.1 aminoglycoside phosphotransferase [Haloferax mediterranei ATCC 33500]AHZ24034.1 aminoglycoside phosphotransferase [Haloferax mediterranei ATCC 33500]ELZ97620.1 aminoglycoside phosphotransferase [Haloferax mediterranei ATCC 33500]MDX5989707.1 phosphotransferase family protein [Haloferax mediterranei ATCC 33500]QCQ77394.1 phosphotransferase family protein [Haloferax mediterranei ATCC 33500]